MRSIKTNQHPVNRSEFKENNQLDIIEDWYLVESSFQQSYTMNLSDKEVIETMSWRRFNVLLAGLPSDATLCETISYRKSKGEQAIEVSGHRAVNMLDAMAT